MATVTQRKPSSEGARQHGLDRLLSQSDSALRRRRQALFANEAEEKSGVTDEEERSMDSREQGLGFSVLELTSRTVQGLETALRRQAAGELGVCAECHARIGAARLRAIPYADLCLECQEKRDGEENATARRVLAVWQEREEWGRAKSVTEVHRPDVR